MTNEEFLRRLRVAVEETREDYANNEDVIRDVIEPFEALLEREERKTR